MCQGKKKKTKLEAAMFVHDVGHGLWWCETYVTLCCPLSVGPT